MNKLNKEIISKDWLILSVIFLITALAFYATYGLVIPAPIQIIIWIAWLVSVCLLGFFTQNGRKVYFFISEAKVELQKVVWPNRQETVQTTAMVMVMVSIMGFILWAIDSLMMAIIAKITHLG